MKKKLGIAFTTAAAVGGVITSLVVGGPKPVKNQITWYFSPGQLSNLLGFIDVRTNVNSTNWTRLRTFAVSPDGGDYSATNTNPPGVFIQSRAGFQVRPTP